MPRHLNAGRFSDLRALSKNVPTDIGDQPGSTIELFTRNMEANG